ncbi:transcriptional regulator NikR, CopG family [Thermocrinis albus DSM 14484]|uniref:Putative nickel-responsive regulator n=1 Tax=Thermocrinis albus (strain DSM 14484 / JCM 11386 / HI 11/12) TaxID=638303 RepID=D3SN23_THEAH|nr:nickel-responsive transcriptional regulator NikR [Thermocrinis albus]ADC90153.1 transcriptional regulator NikR, CopG family [Thermocrinis albus DSM 14484]
MREKYVRFCVSLPKDLLEELDRRTVLRGYSSRSELVRDLIREMLIEDMWEREEEDVVGVLTIVYDHHDIRLVSRMLDVQHKYHVNVLCNTHVHLDHRNCLETMIIKGKASQIEGLSTQLAGMRGVKFAKLVKAGKPEK